MSRLKVILRGTQISEIGLSPDREYIGGRKESCDILMQAEKGISREHFNLKFEDGKWKVQSLSRFGEIFSLGQRVENITLEHGQTFQIPPYEFTYAELTEEIDKKEDLKDLPEISEDERTVINAVPQVPYIKMLSSQGNVREMLRLEFGEIWVAGRDSSCQIVIPDQRVSRRQFEIRKINGIYTILDMDSVNGTFVNGSVVSSTDPLPLKSGDAITVLDNTMYFELHDPNFQYRMERIEVPPFQVAPDVEEVSSEDIGLENTEPMHITEEIVDPNADAVPQLDASGGPFVGMPSQVEDFNANNQYYSFHATPPPPARSAFEKFKSNKPLMIASVLLFLGAMFFLSEYSAGPDNVPVAQQGAQSGDAFSQLTAAQQKDVQNLYAKAQSEMIQSRYDMAKDSLQRLHAILPNGYQDSKEKLEEVILNEETIIAQKAQEEAERIRLENEEKITTTVANCEKILTADITEDRMATCLYDAISINPEHPAVARLRNRVNEIVSERLNKEKERESYAAQVAELNKLFEHAVKLQKDGYPYRAMKAYNSVVESKLPDPKSLKNKSSQRVKFIEETIKKKTNNNLMLAENYIKEGQLKLAISALNEALVFDPDNRTLKERSEKYTNELRLQAMALYQESIIDESFGYVDGTETRSGAKDKWKKIMDIDLADGEYYRKSYIKLKKYGVF